MTLDPDLQAAYLHRLGLDAEPRSVDALQRLHRRHVERVPYETMWLHAGEPWGIDPVESAERIARQSRGGYCYHLNGAFAELLLALGYAVERHSGGVHGAGGMHDGALGNHAVLTVRDLPSPANPVGVWYVDVGLGDALYEALPLVAGEYEEGPFRLALDGPDRDGSWHLAHDPAGGFVGMGWLRDPVDMAEFAPTHTWLSTAPDSPFLDMALAQTRDATGVDVLRGLIRLRVGDGATASDPITDRADWFGVLADDFGIRYDHEPAAADRLWARVVATHRSWEAEAR